MNFLEDIKKTSDLLKNAESSKYQDIDITKIKADEENPRVSFNDINDLAESIKLYGVLSPITVRKDENSDNYIICYGERRYRASLKAGLTTIPAVIVENTDNLKEKQLVENIQRQDLNHAEIATTISYLVDTKGYKKSDVAKLLSKSKSYISMYYNYSKIDTQIKIILLERTNDISLIVEVTKVLNSLSEEEYTKAIAYIESLETFGRNIIGILKNLNSQENYNYSSENTYTDDSYSSSYDSSDDNESNDNEFYEETPKNKKDSYDNDNEDNPYRFASINNCEILDVNNNVIMTLSSEFNDYLQENNRLKKFLSAIEKLG